MKDMFLSNYFDSQRGETLSHGKIIAVGGGKGGVGKSFISSSIAIFLANFGYKTLIIDLDLGAANLHTCLGEPNPTKGLHDFLLNPDASLEDVAIPTQIPNLSLINGANDSLDIANLSMPEKSRLLSAICQIKADYIILDLSAGTHNSTLDFFLTAQNHLIVASPDPSSIENAYRFIKSAFFRKIKRFEGLLGIQECISDLMERGQELGIHTPAQLLKQISEIEPMKGQHLNKMMGTLRTQIVLNQTRTRADSKLGYGMVTICKKYFGLDSQFLGPVAYNDAVWQALRKHRPLLLESPNSEIYSQLLSISRDLVSSKITSCVV